MKGRKRHDIARAGAHRGVLPEPSRRGGRRGRHRRRRRASWCRCPTRSTGRSSTSSSRPRASTRPGIAFLPRRRRRRRDARRGREGARRRGLRACSAGARCRRRRRSPGSAARGACRRSGRSSSTKDGLVGRRARTARVPRAQAHRARDRARTSRRCRRGSSSTRACSRPTSCALLPRPRRRAGRDRAVRSCTRGSRPTRSRAGRSRTRTGCSRTTARSTPCRATRTGCAPVKASWRATCSPATSSACSRSARPDASDTARFDEALELLQPRRPSAAPRDPHDDPRSVGEPRVDGRGRARRSTGITRR